MPDPTDSPMEFDGLPKVPEPSPRSPELSVDRPQVDALRELERLTRDLEDQSLGDRIRGVWTVIRGVADWLVLLAEDLFGPGTGQQKKKWVMDELLRQVELLERRLDLIPGWIQPLVFMLLRRMIAPLVEGAVQKAKRLGDL